MALKFRSFSRSDRFAATNAVQTNTTNGKAMTKYIKTRVDNMVFPLAVISRLFYKISRKDASAKQHTIRSINVIFQGPMNLYL